MKTDYFKMTPRGRFSYLTNYSPGKPDCQMLRAALGSHYPNRTPSFKDKIFHIEAGHGLRVEKAEKYLSRRAETDWYVNEFQETTVAHIIRLPNRRGFLLASSDPWNKDAYTVQSREIWTSDPDLDDHGAKQAARAACRFAELLSEDYRQDDEHQTALADYEERKAELENNRTAALARAQELDAEADAIADEADQVQHPAPAARLRALRDTKRQEAEKMRGHAADGAETLAELTEPEAPKYWNYFQ